MFSQTERRGRGRGGKAQTLSSLSLACPCCVHSSAHFKKATWGWIRSGWAGFGCELPLRQMQQVYDADCQNAALSIYVCICVCALKLLQNGGPNGGKIAAKKPNIYITLFLNPE